MMGQKEMRIVMQGAMILTIASFIAKILSAIYRVPLQNLVGDEGFYVYQQVYPLYGIAMTLALSGLPQFISKYVAEQQTPRDRKRAIERLTPLILVIGLVCWFVLFAFSGLIASLMGDLQLQSLIQVVSFAFLLMPGLSLYRGNFQGQLLMEPTAISQVIEQLLRVAIIVFSALSFRWFDWSVYQTGTVAMSGSIVGGLAALMILYYYENKINGRSLNLLSFNQIRRPSKALLRRVLVEGGLVSIYSGLLLFFQLVDSFFVKNSLELYGLSEQAARIEKGIYDRGQPLVQLGLVIATALSATFLPILTRQLLHKKNSQFIQSAKVFLRLTTSLAVAASVGMTMLLPYINFALFKDYAGNFTLALFVFSVAITAVIQAYQSIAQSKNSFRPSLKAAGWGLLAKSLSTGVLTGMIGTVGSSISTLLGLAIVLFFLVRSEKKEINCFWRERAFSWGLMRCILVMVGGIVGYYGVVHVIFGVIDNRILAGVISICGAGIGVIVFVRSAIRWRLFTVREWLMLPFGKKLLRFKLKKP